MQVLCGYNPPKVSNISTGNPWGTKKVFVLLACKGLILFVCFISSLLLVVGFFLKELQNQMYHSLSVTQGSLPKPARVYSGHELSSCMYRHDRGGS
ncbi:hydroxyacylglutathione hydrolase [Trifolium repens]|nr:hydroxyacylglutathione hydrolase [Trifolium repens]